MAIIKEMVGRQIIDGFKKTVDFYYYMDVPCARKWPRSQGKSQTPASVAQQPMFAYCSRTWNDLSPFVKKAYTDLANACGLHKKDWFTRGYYGKLYRYPTDYTP